jgi:hypothetical protein
MNALGFGQPLSPHNLKEPLQSSPVWCAGRWTRGTSGHVVVVIATNENWVRYYDPWWVGTPEDANDPRIATGISFYTVIARPFPASTRTSSFYPLIHWKG